MNSPSQPGDRAWAEIDFEALRQNALALRTLAKGTELFAIVKANGYGHGVLKVAEALEAEANLFGVASLAEALELKEGGIKTTPFILGTSLPEDRDFVVEHGFQPTLSSIKEAIAWSELAVRSGKTVAVHYKVDTGMGRAGFPESEWSKAVANELAELPGLGVAGICSHFPSADEDADFTNDQIARFERCLESARRGGLRARTIHLANSAGTLGFPKARYDAIRPGLSLYGVSPLPEAQGQISLRPALSLKSRVLDVRTLPKGHGVSYGRDHLLARKTKVASVGIGYGDGLPRSLGEEGSGAVVLIGGKRRAILGRVTMDQILVEASDGEVQAGDEVVVIGSSGGQQISAAEVACWAGTIPWDIFTALTPRVVRRTA